MNQLRTTVVFIFLCLLNRPIQGIDLPWNGVDASELTQVEEDGATFYEWSENDNWGYQTPVPKILALHGVNVARLRLWHSPEDGVNGLDYTLDLAQRLHNEGIGILLAFHFSDSWADPGQQTKPSAWKDKSINTDLRETVSAYVSDVIKAFVSRGITLVGVQFGNETPSGMMWPDGQVGGDYDTPQQWWNLGELFKYARQGLEWGYPEGSFPESGTKVVIHLDSGGDKEMYRWFFNNLIAQGVQFDVIGVSFYPGLDRDLSDLKANLEFCVNEFGRDVAVVETSAAWTLEGFDSTTNIVGMENQLQEGYPATKDGQAKWLYDLTEIVAGLPNNSGLGVISWGATWVIDSPWENQALFDPWGYANPALDALWWN